MKTWQLGPTFGLESLKLVELEEPIPGPGEVVIQVRATSLNYRDLMVARGEYNPRLSLPIVPLSDAAGEVVALGPGVRRWKVGDQVAGTFCQDWPDGPLTDAAARSAMGAGGTGVLAERVVLRESGLVAAPGHLSALETATLPCAAVTAWNALVTRGGVVPGDTVLLQGTGGVSLFALQFARVSGARTILTTSSSFKVQRALALGADVVINSTETPEWDARVREITGGEGVDHVVDVGGASSLPRSLRAVRKGGTISVIGVLSGNRAELPLTQILMRDLNIHGIFCGSRRVFEAMNRAISVHGLRPVVDRVIPFQEAPAAFRCLETSAHFGKIVIEH